MVHLNFFFSLFFALLIIPCLLRPTPTYTINLDDPPEIRWNQVVTQFETEIKLVITKGLHLLQIPNLLIDLLQTQGPAILAYMPMDYVAEIVGISQQTGVSITDVILLNILYDATAACTRIVAPTNDNKIIHARNLDDSIPEILQNLAGVAKKGGSTVFSGASFAGMVCIITGQKPNSFTISANERDKGSRWENLYEMLLNRQAHFLMFEIRRVLEMPGLDYASALREFQVSVMMAPCYLILGGVKPGEGAVITRDKESEISPFPGYR